MEKRRITGPLNELSEKKNSKLLQTETPWVIAACPRRNVLRWLQRTTFAEESSWLLDVNLTREKGKAGNWLHTSVISRTAIKGDRDFQKRP